MNQIFNDVTEHALKKIFYFGKEKVFEYLASMGWERLDIMDCWTEGRNQLCEMALRSEEEVFNFIKAQIDLHYNCCDDDKKIDSSIAECIILDRLLDIFPSDIAQKLLDRFEAIHGIHGDRQKITERTLAVRRTRKERRGNINP